MDLVVRVFNCRFRASLQLVDAAADFALCGARRGFQPDVVDLGEDAVLARQPAIAKRLPVGIGVERRSFVVEGTEEFGNGTVQRFGE